MTEFLVNLSQNDRLKNCHQNFSTIFALKLTIRKDIGHLVHTLGAISGIMLGRDCLRAVFRKQFPPPFNWVKSGFS